MADSIGLVVAAHGQRGLLEADGVRHAFLLKGRRQRIVCGDRVRFQPDGTSGPVLVTAIEPRLGVLARVARHDGHAEVMAANLTQLVLVCAPRPEPDWFLADRFLCAAELAGCQGLLVWNKADLGAPDPLPLDEYRTLGYRVLAVSARSGAGITTLAAELEGQIGALVGQSGVGKSSLINALVPGAAAVIGALSAAGSFGTQTTTAALMYDVGRTGRLIDTPGARTFVPAVASSRLDQGFPELRRLAPGCRFTDCTHSHEPGCAVRHALEGGSVSTRRYDNYQKLRVIVAAPGR
ncbi:MAG: putative ribosome biogenesis GTPase RsgA 2 [Nevskiales bacterium]